MAPSPGSLASPVNDGTDSARYFRNILFLEGSLGRFESVYSLGWWEIKGGRSENDDHTPGGSGLKYRLQHVLYVHLNMVLIYILISQILFVRFKCI